MVTDLITRIFGSKHSRDIRKLRPIVQEINRIFETLRDEPHEFFLEKTEEFRSKAHEIHREAVQYADDRDLDKKERRDEIRKSMDSYLDTILPEAFAMVKEVCRRLRGQKWMVGGALTEWNMVPFDVQLVGAIVLHQGKIAEMSTGEGKTLVATMPLYLNGLTGRGAHLVTVNDYLAMRDREWMGSIYEYLGLTVGCIQNGMNPRERREQYNCDIVYGTNNEFGFDYLRDNMVWSKENRVHRGFIYAIVDEIDSVLIDEARTPLIISGPVKSTIKDAFREVSDPVRRLATKQNELVKGIIETGKNALEKGDFDEAAHELLTAHRGSPKSKKLMEIYEEPGVQKAVKSLELRIMREQKNLNSIDERLFYAIDEHDRSVHLTTMGQDELNAQLSGKLKTTRAGKKATDPVDCLYKFDPDSKASREERFELIDILLADSRQIRPNQREALQSQLQDIKTYGSVDELIKRLGKLAGKERARLVKALLEVEADDDLSLEDRAAAAGELIDNCREFPPEAQPTIKTKLAELRLLAPVIDRIAGDDSLKADDRERLARQIASINGYNDLDSGQREKLIENFIRSSDRLVSEDKAELVQKLRSINSQRALTIEERLREREAAYREHIKRSEESRVFTIPDLVEGLQNLERENELTPDERSRLIDEMIASHNSISPAAARDGRDQGDNPGNGAVLTPDQKADLIEELHRFDAYSELPSDDQLELTRDMENRIDSLDQLPEDERSALVAELRAICDRKRYSEDDLKMRRAQIHDEHRRLSQRDHAITQLLKAHSLFEKDVDYVVMGTGPLKKVVLVDEFTGRLMPGRRLSDGLHQAIEYKEGAKVEEETQTVATITLQNYFRMYEKLAGMTGTAETEAGEFWNIYKLDVVVIPPNKPVRRLDFQDLILRTKDEKYKAIIEEIVHEQKRGRPILVGTISVEVSELLSRRLKSKGIAHNVLNAREHRKEAAIIREAGQPGTVTIATNMAGRGTDIRLDESVLKHPNCALVELPEHGAICPHKNELNCTEDIPCGLHIIGTERHESRRIDRQLRGRSGRQGDPGSSRFYLSAEDDLLRLFGSDRVATVMDRLGMKEGEVISSGILTKQIERAQRRVEAENFSIRKRTLEYDDVMNSQREVIYTRRNEVIDNDDISELVQEKIRDLIEGIVNHNVGESPESWDFTSLCAEVVRVFGRDLDKSQDELMSLSNEQLIEVVYGHSQALHRRLEELFTPAHMRKVERHAFLEAINRNWRDHLYEMDQLRTGISMRAYGQRDPLVEYKKEAYRMFVELVDRIDRQAVTLCFHALPADDRQLADQSARELSSHQAVHRSVDRFGADASSTQDETVEGNRRQPFKRKTRKVGRNDPCPCGSGKKYKKCCGAGRQ